VSALGEGWSECFKSGLTWKSLGPSICALGGGGGVLRGNLGSYGMAEHRLAAKLRDPSWRERGEFPWLMPQGFKLKAGH
jgi:hypothetical protein